jgi:hypothetical protein
VHVFLYELVTQLLELPDEVEPTGLVDEAAVVGLTT